LEPTDEQKRNVGGPATGEFDTINAGLYVMRREALEAIPQRRCNIEREVFPRFVSEGEAVYGDVREDFWIDIGKPSQYLEAIAAIVSGEVGSPRSFLRVEEGAVDPDADVADDVRLCCGCTVGAGAVIAAGSEICNSAVLEGVQIGENCKVVGSIIGEGAVIGEESEIMGSASAPGSVIGAFSRVGSVK
jgi:mannose-1-phosphate guanylyltransferase